MIKPESRAEQVDKLIQIISDKLQANRGVLERSLAFGRLSWRLNRKNNVIEVDLEPKI